MMVKALRWAGILLLTVVLVVGFVLALDLPERKLKKADEATKGKVADVATAFRRYRETKKDFPAIGFRLLDQGILDELSALKLISSSFMTSVPVYYSLEEGKDGWVWACFIPTSKYFRAGSENTLTLGNPAPVFLGGVGCKAKDYSSLPSSCVQCVKK